MKRVATYLGSDVVKGLKELYENSNKSMSKIIAELIDIGYKVKLHHKENQSNPLEERKAFLREKHTEYLLRAIAIASDIYRCVRNDQSKYDVETADEAIDIIVNNAKKFINGIPSGDK